MESERLTHPGGVISLLTPTQDLVFAKKRSGLRGRGEVSGDLTVARRQVLIRLAGLVSSQTLSIGVPCDPR